MPMDDVSARAMYGGITGKVKRTLKKSYRYWSGQTKLFQQARKGLTPKPRRKIPIKAVEKLRQTQEEKKRRIEEIGKY